MSEKITLLGSTGSIGQSALAIIAEHPQRYDVFALAANTQVDVLFQQCQKFVPHYAVMACEEAAQRLSCKLEEASLSTQVLGGEEGAVFIAAHKNVDTVLAAIVGAAGLTSALAAAHAGKKILLANKESLVLAGSLFMQAVKNSGAVLLPIDSEHNAIFQCFNDTQQNNAVKACGADLKDSGIEKILLTASGGPFRQTPLDKMQGITPEQACAHPNWSMGRKISVDSASMMNKGLELIEACWLFDVQPEDIEVVVHPQSIIHSMVQYIDGSTLAQLGNPDMRTPIAHALAWPQRIDAGVKRLNIFDVARLDFEAPDLEKFACLRLAKEAAAAGGTWPAVLNAANEVAVDAFLNDKIGFLDIARLNESVMQALPSQPVAALDDVLLADSQARQLAAQHVDAL